MTTRRRWTPFPICSSRNSPKARSSSIPIGSLPILCAGQISAAALCHAAAGLCRLRAFQRRYRHRDRPQGASSLLPASVPAPAALSATSLSDTHQAALPDGCRLSETARQGFSALSDVPFDRSTSDRCCLDGSAARDRRARPAGTPSRARPHSRRPAKFGRSSHPAQSPPAATPAAPRLAVGFRRWFCGQIPPITLKKRYICAGTALPSPSCHIYNPLTISAAFRRLGAFERVRQHPIKVDGTFA